MTIFPSWSHLCEGVAKFYGVHTHISRLCACQRLISLFELVSRLSLDWLVPQCQYMNSPNTQARCPVEQDTAVYFHAVCYSCHNVDLFAQQLHVVWTETCQASVWNPQCNFAWHQCESRGMFPVLLLGLIAFVDTRNPKAHHFLRCLCCWTRVYNNFLPAFCNTRLLFNIRCTQGMTEGLFNAHAKNA